ncbi:hypothetical protein [Streptomyces sp. NPDC052225]|uniref:hypothetical protein n=1 Tax=Streptomyces sp. NPDC052225 TaxID=3154949 RepID=UPI0034279914
MNSGGDQSGSSVSDEEWERFLRESEEGVRDAPKEPSARARMVTRRLREQDAAPEPWRAHRPPRRSKVWYVVGLVAALALVIVALNPGRAIGWFGGGDDTDAAPLATESVRPSTAPPAGDAERPTLDEPFRGSPAARWADGTAGIGLPAAKATGWMTKDQVTRALESSRDFLAASSLDRDVLRGDRPDRAIAFLNPRQKDVRKFLATSLTAPSKTDNPLTLFSRFDGTKVRLVGDVVKVRGRMTYEEGEYGALKVTADVTYVYPVAPASGGDQVVRTIVRREVVMSWDDPSKRATEPGTVSLLSYRVDSANGGCGTYTGYLVPDFDQDSGPGDGPTVDPYDRSRTVDERMSDGGTCGTATRT